MVKTLTKWFNIDKYNLCIGIIRDKRDYKKIGCVYGNNNNDNDDDNNDNNDTIQRLTSLADKIILIAYRLEIRAKKESVAT
jgi:hypothetical protein